MFLRLPLKPNALPVFEEEGAIKKKNEIKDFAGSHMKPGDVSALEMLGFGGFPRQRAGSLA